MKTINIKISGQELTMSYVKGMIKLAKEQGYGELTFTHEPLLGPFLSIDLQDFDDNGEEKLAESPTET